MWVKAVPHADGWTVKPGELSWVNDAGIIDKHGYRVYREDGQAAGKPSWRVGDPVGLYSDVTKRVSVLGEVAYAPSFDPTFVAAESGSAKDGQRWPWVTMIRVLHCDGTDCRADARRARDRRTRHAAADAQAARRRSGQGAARRAHGDLTISITPAPTVTSVEVTCGSA